MGALQLGLISALILVCLPSPIFTAVSDLEIHPEEVKYDSVKFITRPRRDAGAGSNDTSAASALKTKKLEPQGAKRGASGAALMGVVNLLLRQQKNGKPLPKAKKGATTTTPTPDHGQVMQPKRPKSQSAPQGDVPQSSPSEQDESEAARAQIGFSKPPWANPQFASNMAGGLHNACTGRGACDPPPSDSCSEANIYDREVVRSVGITANCCKTYKCYNPDGSFFTFHGFQGILGGTQQGAAGGGYSNAGNNQGGYNSGAGYNNQGGSNSNYGPPSSGYNNNQGSNYGPGGSGYNNQGNNNGAGNSGYNQGGSNYGPANSGYNNQGVNNGAGNSGYNQGGSNYGPSGSGYNNQGGPNKVQGGSGYNTQGQTNVPGYNNQGASNYGQGNSGYTNPQSNNRPGSGQNNNNRVPPIPIAPATPKGPGVTSPDYNSNLMSGFGFTDFGSGGTDYVIDTAKIPTDGRKYGGIDTDRLVQVAVSGKANVEATAHDAGKDEDEEPQTDIYDMEYELEKVQKQNQRMMDQLSKAADAALPPKGRSFGRRGRKQSRL